MLKTMIRKYGPFGMALSVAMSIAGVFIMTHAINTSNYFFLDIGFDAMTIGMVFTLLLYYML